MGGCGASLALVGYSSGAIFNAMCLKFRAAPLPFTLRSDLEPFAVVFMRPDLDEAAVEAKWSWYNNSEMANLLFKP